MQPVMSRKLALFWSKLRKAVARFPRLLDSDIAMETIALIPSGADASARHDVLQDNVEVHVLVFGKARAEDPPLNENNTLQRQR